MNGHFPSRSDQQRRPKRDLLQLGKPVIASSDLRAPIGSCDCVYPTSAADFGTVATCSECPEGTAIGWSVSGLEPAIGLPMIGLKYSTGCDWVASFDDVDSVAIVATLSLDDPDLALLTIDLGNGDEVVYAKAKSMWGCNCANEMVMLCPSVALSRLNLPCRVCVSPLRQLPIMCCSGSGLPDQMSVEISQLNNLSTLQPIDGTVITLDFVVGQTFGVSWDGYLGSVASCTDGPTEVENPPVGCTRTEEITNLLVGLACFDPDNCGGFCGSLYAIYGFEFERVDTCPGGTTTTTWRLYDYLAATDPQTVPPSGYSQLNCQSLTASAAVSSLNVPPGGPTIVGGGSAFVWPCGGNGSQPDGFTKYSLDFSA